MDCDKHKKRALIGLILFSYFIIGRIIDFSLYLSFFIDIFISLIIFILGLYLMLPYARCLGDFNNRNKPPFS